MKKFISALLFVALASAACDFKLSGFTQTGTYSVAQQQGFFAQAGLSVCYSPVVNSVAAYTNIATGEFDALSGTIDNTVNRVLNGAQNVTVLAGIDLAPDQVIVGTNGVKKISDLKGKSIIVDAATSGFAFMIQKIMKAHGLYINVDYTFVPVGSTNLRYPALLNGTTSTGVTVYATLLTYPFTGYLANANRPDITVLAKVSDFVNPFQSTAINVQTSTLSNPVQVEKYTKFLTAFVLAQEFIKVPANKNAVISSIAADLGVSTAVAAREYEAVTDPVTGELVTGDLTVSRIGLINVIFLRQEFLGFNNNQDDYTPALISQQEGGKIFNYAILDAAKARAATIKCSVIKVVQSLENSWTDGGNQISQYKVQIQNSKNQVVNPVAFTITAAQQANIKNIWNLQVQPQNADGTFTYVLPSYQAGVPAGGSYSFGYQVANGMTPFTVDPTRSAC